jgi:hypothetical protein
MIKRQGKNEKMRGKKQKKVGVEVRIFAGPWWVVVGGGGDVVVVVV